MVRIRSPHQLRSLIHALAMTVCTLLWLAPPSVQAHIGAQHVFFETKAGPYPVRVTIKSPQVVPGLAEIFVRTHQDEVDTISVLPVRYDSGRQGAPPPDLALPVENESGLYRAELWFMKSGAHSVIVNVEGANGSGEAMVPFDAIATRTLPMSPFLSIILALMGILLVALASSIAGAAVRQAVLPPGAQPSRRRLWASRAVTFAQLVFIMGMVYLGKSWWDSEDLDYRNNQLYEPMATEAVVQSEPTRELRLTITDDRFRRGSPLLPDHGKLMHLFLIREDSQAFAHLHPNRADWDLFANNLPALPSGNYHLFADITHETGFSHTLTNLIQISDAPPSAIRPGDRDDSWNIQAETPREGVTVPATIELMSEARFPTGQEIELNFSVFDSSRQRARLEPYMGMKSHVIVYKKDATVFSHLHPSGSISMASLQAFESRLAGDGKPPTVAYGQLDPLCQLPSVEESTARWWDLENQQDGVDLTFPYAFPSSGDYKIWVQVKVDGQVVTQAFDLKVE